MRQALMQTALGAVAFMILDGVWLGLLMKNFYCDQLAPIVRLADGGIVPNWLAAFVVYVLLGTGIALLVIPRASTVSPRCRSATGAVPRTRSGCRPSTRSAPA